MEIYISQLAQYSLSGFHIHVYTGHAANKIATAPMIRVLKIGNELICSGRASSYDGVRKTFEVMIST
jgi:hypothetical protein